MSLVVSDVTSLAQFSEAHFRALTSASLSEGGKDRGAEWWLAMFPCADKPFSGKLVLRMSSELHGRIAIAAASKGATINDFINRALMSVLS